MNKVILMGRLVRDPEVRYSTGLNPVCVAKYTLAVDRRFKKDGESSADFINCIAFGKLGEIVEKYLHKGTKVTISGRIQTGSYTNRDGQKVYTTDVIVEEQEFAENKNQSIGTYQNQSSPSVQSPFTTDSGGFMNIPDGIEEELPFV